MELWHRWAAPAASRFRLRGRRSHPNAPTQNLTDTIQQLEARRKSGEEAAQAAAAQAEKIQVRAGGGLGTGRCMPQSLPHGMAMHLPGSNCVPATSTCSAS